MRPAVFTPDALNRHYTKAIDALCEIARAYFFLGRGGDALHLLQTALSLTEADEVAQMERLKLLLLSGRVLIVDHLLHRGDPARMFSTIRQAQQVAEAMEDQQGRADAWSLLGYARTNATTIATVKRGAMPFGSQGQGDYEEALTYHQQALPLQEALQDTRGMSETHFGIGLIYQFWQQHEVARGHLTTAIQIAEQHGHVLEQAEPHRHLAMDALFKGDLDEALVHAELALAFREASGFRPYQPLDHLTLRDLHLKKGDTASAQFHLERASVLAEEMGLSTLVSSAINATSLLRTQPESA